MDLKQLQYFVVCAQTGSFSDAAKVLYSTQPSVSKVVKGNPADGAGAEGISICVQDHK